MVTTPDLDEFFRKLESAHRRRQRKLTQLSVDETSGVDFPAHGVSGWVVLKSVDAHGHRPDAAYLEGPALESARYWADTDAMQPGQNVTISADRSLGKSACGCVYILNPETMAKAESDAWVASYRENMAKAASGWSPEEVAYLEDEIKRMQQP